MEASGITYSEGYESVFFEQLSRLAAVLFFVLLQKSFRIELARIVPVAVVEVDRLEVADDDGVGRNAVSGQSNVRVRAVGNSKRNCAEAKSAWRRLRTTAESGYELCGFRQRDIGRDRDTERGRG